MITKNFLSDNEQIIGLIHFFVSPLVATYGSNPFFIRKNLKCMELKRNTYISASNIISKVQEELDESSVIDRESIKVEIIVKLIKNILSTFVLDKVKNTLLSIVQDIEENEQIRKDMFNMIQQAAENNKENLFLQEIAQKFNNEEKIKEINDLELLSLFVHNLAAENIKATIQAYFNMKEHYLIPILNVKKELSEEDCEAKITDKTNVLEELIFFSSGFARLNSGFAALLNKKEKEDKENEEKEELRDLSDFFTVAVLDIVSGNINIDDVINIMVQCFDYEIKKIAEANIEAKFPLLPFWLTKREIAETFPEDPINFIVEKYLETKNVEEVIEKAKKTINFTIEEILKKEQEFQKENNS